MKRSVAVVAVAMAVGGLAAAPAGAGTSKVEVCHLRGDGSFGLVTVSERALRAHLGHGDALVGDPVPGSAGLVFDDSCTGIEADRDGDGVVDLQDNCPLTANPDQADLDGDLTGDQCDADLDGDGVDNTDDAFPFDPAETDDTDADGIGDNADNCPVTPNPGQEDGDGDGTGDACEPATILVSAWTVDAAGDEILIARLIDTDGDGTASPGDTVETGVFPTSFDGSSSRGFPAGTLEVVAVPIWDCPSGGPQAQVTVAGGYLDWYGWPGASAEGFAARWTDEAGIHEVSLRDYFGGWDRNFEDWWFTSTNGAVERGRRWSPKDDTYFDVEFDASICS